MLYNDVMNELHKLAAFGVYVPYAVDRLFSALSEYGASIESLRSLTVAEDGNIDAVVEYPDPNLTIYGEYRVEPPAALPAPPPAPITAEQSKQELVRSVERALSLHRGTPVSSKP